VYWDWEIILLHIFVATNKCVQWFLCATRMFTWRLFVVEFMFPLKTTRDVTLFDKDGIYFWLDAVVWATTPFGWVYADSWFIERPALVSFEELAYGFTKKKSYICIPLVLKIIQNFCLLQRVELKKYEKNWLTLICISQNWGKWRQGQFRLNRGASNISNRWRRGNWI
jgi:hypothetical protein